MIRTEEVFVLYLGPTRASGPERPLCEKCPRCVVELLETHEIAVDFGDLRHKELICTAAISSAFALSLPETHRSEGPLETKLRSGMVSKSDPVTSDIIPAYRSWGQF